MSASDNISRLIEILKKEKISDEIINDAVDSGYIIRDAYAPFSNKIYEVVSDQMYGNKQFSGFLNLNDFIEYLKGNNTFDALPKFNEYTVKNYDDIERILSEPRRQNYINEGRLSFRGQTSQYTFKRRIPSPVRGNKHKQELSIFPGLYRQKDDYYSFNLKNSEERSFIRFLRELEPNTHSVYSNSNYSSDIMRVEQHYASQTSGLDISFDIETAIFFSTYKLKFNSSGKAYHVKINKGEHQGVIYGFCFTDPPVKKTEFLIRKFDLFKTYNPERILRQNCGLPLIREHERNIAITDLDFIIYLDKDFDYNGKREPSYMFPNTREDLFYGKLLELKDNYPDELSNIIEYEGSRF